MNALIKSIEVCLLSVSGGLWTLYQGGLWTLSGGPVNTVSGGPVNTVSGGPVNTIRGACEHCIRGACEHCIRGACEHYQVSLWTLYQGGLWTLYQGGACLWPIDFQYYIHAVSALHVHVITEFCALSINYNSELLLNLCFFIFILLDCFSSVYQTVNW